MRIKEKSFALRRHIADLLIVRVIRNKPLSWYPSIPLRLLRYAYGIVRQKKEALIQKIEKTRTKIRHTQHKRIAREVARAFGRKPALTVLYISHDWGGGTQRYIDDRAQELRSLNRDLLIAVPAESGTPFAKLLAPNGVANLADAQFDFSAKPEKLQRLFGLLKVDTIEVHSTAGWSSQILSILPEISRRCGIPYKVMLHDYIAICPTSLINPKGSYCGEPDAAECAVCISQGDRAPYSVHPDMLDKGGLDIQSWRLLYGNFLQNASQIMTPSSDASRRMNRYFSDITIDIRPHRENISGRKIGGRAPLRDKRLKVVVIGHITKHKGFDVLLGCAKDASARGLPVDFSVVGYTCDDDSARAENIAVTGRYKESEVFDLLESEQPHMAFLPSVWLETYCYTLSIAMAAELPSVVFDIGAQAERVKASAIEGLCLPIEMSMQFNLINDELLRFWNRIQNGSLGNNPDQPSLAC